MPTDLQTHDCIHVPSIYLKHHFCNSSPLGREIPSLATKCASEVGQWQRAVSTFVQKEMRVRCQQSSHHCMPLRCQMLFQALEMQRWVKSGPLSQTVCCIPAKEERNKDSGIRSDCPMRLLLSRHSHRGQGPPRLLGRGGPRAPLSKRTAAAAPREAPEPGREVTVRTVQI